VRRLGGKTPPRPHGNAREADPGYLDFLFVDASAVKLRPAYQPLISKSHGVQVRMQIMTFAKAPCRKISALRS